MNRASVILIILLILGVSGIAAQDPIIPTCDPNSPLANGEPSTSPDGRYVVFFDCYTPQQTIVTVTVHDQFRGRVYELGETALDLRTESIYVSRWLSDTQVAFRSETGGGTYNWRSVYVADADVEGSLREIARDYVSRPRYFDAEPHYEWSIEDGISETFTVYRYDVTSDETTEIFTGDCLPRDELQNELSCHMVTPTTNADYVDEDTPPDRMILNIGDSARETKTVEIWSLPDSELLYSVDGLGSGYGDWVSADTAAIFNLAFDFETAGFRGWFIQFDDENAIINEEPFVLPNGAEMNLLPSWITDELQ